MKSIKKIKGFVISLTAMSLLFGASMNINLKNIGAAELEQKSNVIFDQGDRKERPKPDEIKNFGDIPFADFQDKHVFDKDGLDINFNYETKDYLDDYNRVIGSYPVINDMYDLSNQILSDINSSVAELDLNIDDEIYDSIVNFSVDKKSGYVQISVLIYNPNDNSSNYLNYYLDIMAKKQISSEEYLNAINIENKSDRRFGKNKIEDNHDSEFTMVPLRVNAEKLGWEVNWEQKKDHEPSKAILKKDNKQIQVLVNADLDYDLVVNDDLTRNFIKTSKLDRKAELQDNTLYVPMSFIDKFLVSESKPNEDDRPPKRIRDNITTDGRISEDRRENKSHRYRSKKENKNNETKSKSDKS